MSWIYEQKARTVNYISDGIPSTPIFTFNDSALEIWPDAAMKLVDNLNGCKIYLHETEGGE